MEKNKDLKSTVIVGLLIILIVLVVVDVVIFKKFKKFDEQHTTIMNLSFEINQVTD